MANMKEHSIPLLINFLKQPALKYSDICIFLLNNIFKDHEFSCVLISQVSKSGLIDVVGSFGLPETQKSALNGVSPISDHPLSAQVFENSIDEGTMIANLFIFYCFFTGFSAMRSSSMNMLI